MTRSIFVVLVLLSVCRGFYIKGRLSSRRDDAYSKAICPKGYAVSYCEVFTGNVQFRSDGAFVFFNGRTSTCVAVNGWRGSGAIARARCSQNTHVYSRCKRAYVQRFINLHSRGSAPSVSCPLGYKQILCNAMSPWTPLLDNKGVSSKGIIPNDRSCSLSRCSQKNWCQVTAVCQAEEQCQKVIIGHRSRSRDDAESRAVCPSGYVVSHCEVLTGNVDYRSDGAYVSHGSGRVCVAVNGARGSGAVARAECSRNRSVYNRCRRAYVQKFLHLYSVGAAPSVSCPRGYQQILCNAHSPWSGQLSRKGVSQNGIIPNHRRCRVTGCSRKNYCTVTAVCQSSNYCT